MDLNCKVIQETLELVKPRTEEFANRFYKNLFQDHPAIQPLFAQSNLEKQKRLLIASLFQVVQNIENPAFLGEYLGKMGERYADNGVEDQHIDWVGRSLLKTLKAMLGTSWTDECQRQWVLAFALFAALTREGLAKRQPLSLLKVS